MNGQAQQDKFVMTVLKNKKNGYFVEIGSNHPIHINNTFLLEKILEWKGIMIEYDKKYLPLYKEHRQNSIHIINNATLIDYKKLFEQNNVPLNIDYLQIDLEANNGSTLETLEKLDREVLDNYKFATVTFEHDFYSTNYRDTRANSRLIFEKRGYFRVFDDITNFGNPYEDWYVHPSLVDMTYVQSLKQKNQKNYTDCKIKGVLGLNWEKIEY